jgi:hypothetical protein
MRRSLSDARDRSPPSLATSAARARCRRECDAMAVAEAQQGIVHRTPVARCGHHHDSTARLHIRRHLDRVELLLQDARGGCLEVNQPQRGRCSVQHVHDPELADGQTGRERDRGAQRGLRALPLKLVQPARHSGAWQWMNAALGRRPQQTKSRQPHGGFIVDAAEVCASRIEEPPAALRTGGFAQCVSRPA